MGTPPSAAIQLQLASKSPRRRELLTQIGVRYSVVEVNVPERKLDSESPLDYVCRLAKDKACAGALKFPGIATLGSDTIVCLGDEVLEKPKDENDAVAMLQRLSGASHTVYTAIALTDGDKIDVAYSDTKVRFRKITNAEAHAYWATGEAADKAGAYGIQGLGAVFVEQITGSYSGVVGLPIETLYPMLKAFDIPVWQS